MQMICGFFLPFLQRFSTSPCAAKAAGGSKPAPRALVHLPFCAVTPDHLPDGCSSGESSVSGDLLDETVGIFLKNSTLETESKIEAPY